MDIQRARRPLRFLPLLLLTLGLGACVSTGRLGEYDFRDRTVALVLVAPARPDVFTGEDFEVWRGDWAATLAALGGEIVKEREAHRLRGRLDEAVAGTDVAGLLGDRALDRSARILRMEPVTDAADADFEVEVHLRAYGIEAEGWDAQARFFVDARVRLVDAVDGSEVWAADVTESDPVNEAVLGLPDPLGDVVTAATLARLGVDEIERALGGLAEYAADRIGERLRKGWEKASRG